MMRLTTGLIVAGSAAVLLAGCGEQKSEPAHIVRPVLSVTAELRDALQSPFAGTVEPRISAQLAFRVLGRIVSREVNVGDRVAKGQALAAIDPTALQLQLQSARASLTSAMAQAANATANEERQRALLATNTTPQAIYDLAKQTRASALAGVEQARAAVAKAEEQLGYARLFSDFDGVVTAVGAEVGQVVAVGQMVVTVARTDARDAVIDIPDQLAATLAPGTAFTVSLQSAPAIRAIGKVREIAPQADSATRTRRVKLALEDAPDAFRLGSTVSAARRTAVAPTITLPRSALLMDNGRTAVWVVDTASATVSLKDIKVAALGADSFTVAGGIDAGTRVVTAGVHSLKPGQKVKLDGEELPK